MEAGKKRNQVQYHRVLPPKLPFSPEELMYLVWRETVIPGTLSGTTWRLAFLSEAKFIYHNYSELMEYIT